MADDLSPHGSNPPGQSAPSEEDLDRYMRLLDRALERGLLSDVDYMLRADALQHATGIEEMNEIVQQLPILETPAKTRPTRSGAKRRGSDTRVKPQMSDQMNVQMSDQMNVQPPTVPIRPPVNVPADLSDQTEEPPFDPDDLSALDAVDVAMLMRSVQVKKAPSTNRRFAALAVVGILFVALIILGLYLASHEHAVNGSNGILLPHHLIRVVSSKIT